MNLWYAKKAARAMQAKGATVISGMNPPDPIGMFDIVSTPRPFEENEEAALDEVIRCLSDYYDQVLKESGQQEGLVYIQNTDRTDPESVAIKVGVMAGDCYVGPHGGDIARIKEAR